MGMIVMTSGNDADLRLRDLRVLSTLLLERSLTRAAETLDTSQPSISKVLARLRRHFGDPLFIRSGNTMHPTPRALEIAGPLHSVLISSDALRDSSKSFDPGSSDRLFTLLLTDVGMMLFLPPLMSQVSEQAQKLRLRAAPFDSKRFETKLESGEADLALGVFPRAPRGLRRQRLYFSSYLSVARRDHPKLAALRSRSGFCAARHIIVMASDTGHSAHQIVQQALEAIILPESVFLRLSSFLAAAIVASQTDGIATIPATVATFFAEKLDLAVFRPPAQLPAFEIAQYWHERYHRDAGHRWLRSICFDLFARSRL
jgi:DNA-binding transcriptional LysR family regulator